MPVDGELVLAEKSLFLELGQWNLLDHPAELLVDELNPVSESQSFKLDVEKNKVTDKTKVIYAFLEAQKRLDELTGLETVWDERVLARWLDRHCRTQDVPQSSLLKFVLDVVNHQIKNKQVNLALLLQAKYRLAKAITRKIDLNRKQAQKKGRQSLLFDKDDNPKVSFSYAFSFPKNQYPATSFYHGSYQFQKHYYGNHRIGGLREKRKDGKSSEEFICAQAIDMHPKLKYWVRNLDSRPQTSLRLPLADGWFYPDFVALLYDGRIFIIEYKGEHLQTNEDTQEKANIGELWEEKSNGKGIFLMAVKNRNGVNLFDQINNKISI